MACVSSHHWRRAPAENARADHLICHENMADEHRGFHHRSERSREETLPPATSMNSKHPGVNLSLKSPTIVRPLVTGTNHKQRHAVPKTPISLCFETIIGAAEVVARRDELLAAQRKAESSSSNWNKRLLDENSAPADAANSPSERYANLTPGEVQELLADKGLYKSLILNMALQRTQKSKDKEVVQSERPPQLISEGFYWKDYPALEDLLYGHMGEYYEWSTRSRQSKHQQAFNNALVEKVRTVAAAHGNEFDTHYFTDKRLRDRIRCFFKTHLQNAKKRLVTMQKNLSSKNYRTMLLRLIEQAQAQVDSNSSMPGDGEVVLLRTVSSSDCSLEERPVRARKRRRST